MRTCRPLLAVLALVPMLAAAATADPFAAARREFQVAYAATATASRGGGFTDSKGLRDYPLYPYLQAARLQRRFADPAAATEVQAFLQAHGDEPVARSLRRSWLMELALRKQWAAYLAAYREDRDDTAAAQCNALAARVALGRTAGLAESAMATYLTPTSLPPACDPAIAWLRDQGLLTPALVERRARLALDQGEASLARFLARALPEKQAAPINQWAALIEQPRSSLDALIDAPSRSVEPAALLAGWTRFARGDAETAAARFATLVLARGLDERAASPFALAVALPLSWSRHPQTLEFFALVHPDDFDELGHEWRVRAALWAGDWPLVQRSIAAMPEGLRNQNRWRYWAARAAEQLGDRDAARGGYAAVVPTDNWYAALSAARLGQRFVPSLQPIARDDAALQRVAAEPGLVRTRELIRCGLQSEANLEWLVATEPLAPELRSQAVLLASSWGWHLQAIATAARQSIFNDYELLYPRPFDPEVRQAAQVTRLPEALIYAVIRQESLYRTDARSSAGALGLMQLMPATARRTAASAGVAKPSQGDLLVPTINVKLGSTFLRSLLDRAGGQWPVAIAGYNAGPGAARRWLPAAPMETDAWVENIPYNETRNYVQRVHWHSLVFAWLQDRKPREVSSWLGTVRPAASDAAFSSGG